MASRDKRMAFTYLSLLLGQNEQGSLTRPKAQFVLLRKFFKRVIFEKLISRIIENWRSALVDYFDMDLTVLSGP